MLEKYQQFAQTNIQPTILSRPAEVQLLYYALGLNGEAGEVAEKVKKVLRDGNGKLSEADKAALKKELGDCMWYLSNIASMVGLTLQEILEANITKLTTRVQTGTLSGNGDDREIIKE